MRKCVIIFPITTGTDADLANAYTEAKKAFPEHVVLHADAYLTGQPLKRRILSAVNDVITADCIYMAAKYDRCPVGRAAYAVAKELDIDIVNPNIL